MPKYELQPLTIVNVAQGISRSKDFTWAALGFAIGAKSPVLPLMKAALEETGFYDMGEGVIASTKGTVSKYQMN